MTYKTEKEIRNLVAFEHEDERALAELQAEAAAKTLLNKYANEPEFLKRVTVALAKQTL